MSGDASREPAVAQIHHITTPLLNIAYEESGPAAGPPAMLLHGFPYDPRAYDEVVPILNAAGLRTIVPYLRGYGETKFLSAETMRSGEQAAIGQDLADLMDALNIKDAVLAGFDWGARAACVVAAAWPERARGLVTCAGYQIQDIANAKAPADPDSEWRYWYQYYFQTERGRAGLAKNRDGLCMLLWRQWSPTWPFDATLYQRTAGSFDNADFIDVVIHSYRHRMGNMAGDPRYARLEAALSTQPTISVPTFTIHGAVDAVNPVGRSEGHGKYFTGPYERRVFQNVGHNPPAEDPQAFAKAVLALSPMAA